jgi:hypothetical protein
VEHLDTFWFAIAAFRPDTTIIDSWTTARWAGRDPSPRA